MSVTAPAVLPNRTADLLPGLTAAVSFSVADILLKVVFTSGMDALSLAALRGVVVVAFFMVWLRVGPPTRRHTPQERLIALGIGMLFSITMFGLLQSIALLPVSIAILAYFVYPLLTGLAGAATGVDRVGWRALAAAATAFIGLGMMLGFHLDSLAPLGLACAFIAAVARVVTLLLTRAYLNQADARLTTWYSMVPSTAVYLIALGFVGSWHVPELGRRLERLHRRHRHHDAVDLVDLYFHCPHRAIPHGADHEPGAVADDAVQHPAAGRDADAGARRGCGADDRLAGSIPGDADPIIPRMRA